jgi:hypothetical protein
MGYSEALEAAGAKIIAFQEFGSYQGNWFAFVELALPWRHSKSEFGSYQGDWFAFVEYQGKRGWVQGSYGSCSGCDAFQSEFDYGSNGCREHWYKTEDDCNDCKLALADYDKRLTEFGASYLDYIQSQDEAEANAAKNIDWDIDAAEELAFVKSFRDYVVSA